MLKPLPLAGITVDWQMKVLTALPPSPRSLRESLRDRSVTLSLHEARRSLRGACVEDNNSVTAMNIFFSVAWNPNKLHCQLWHTCGRASWHTRIENIKLVNHCNDEYVCTQARKINIYRVHRKTHRTICRYSNYRGSPNSEFKREFLEHVYMQMTQYFSFVFLLLFRMRRTTDVA